MKISKLKINMTSLSDVKEGVSTAIDIIKFIHKFVDDYVKAIPEAKEFANKCDEYLKIEKIYIQGSLPNELVNSKINIISAKSKCEKIINKYSSDKSLIGKASVMLSLLRNANSYRKYFKEKSGETHDAIVVLSFL